MAESIYGYKIKTLQGNEISMDVYKGNVLLIVNTASECGRTPQLEDLEMLYKKYRASGLMVLGFPSNDFAQEPLEGEALKEFCEMNYGVTFPILEKVNVNGQNAHPLFHFFADKQLNGKTSRPPKWNFYKYLVGHDGQLIDSYWSYRRPKNRKIIRAIEKALSAADASKNK